MMSTNVVFPRVFEKSGSRVGESQGGAMDDSIEAVAYNGTADKMWCWILRPFADRALALLPASGRILDVGTGPGLMPAYWASRRPDAEVMGVDVSTAMLELARENANRAGVGSRVRLLQCDARTTKLPDRHFDVVVSHYMLHHFEDPSEVLVEMERLLRPGGCLLVRDLNRPGPTLARIFTRLTAIWLRNTRVQNQQYAESLAASYTAGELQAAATRAGLRGFQVRSGPIHNIIEYRNMSNNLCRSLPV